MGQANADCTSSAEGSAKTSWLARDRWHGALEFKALAEAISTSVFALSPDGRCIYANTTAQRWSGKAPSILEGLGYLRLVSSDQRKIAFRAWRKARGENVAFEVELQLTNSDGDRHWHLVRGAPVRGSGGQVVRWIVSCTDIHQLRTALAAAQDATELLKVVGASTDALVFAKDAAGTMVYVNDAALKVIGGPAEQVIGKPLHAHARCTSELDAILRNDAEVKRAGKLVVAEERWTTPDGVERVYRSTKGPWLRADGTTGIIGFTVDLTRERAAEAAARESNHRFQAIFDNVPAVLWLTDAKGRPLIVNNVWTDMSGMPPKADGYSLSELLHPDDQDSFYEAWNDVIADGGLLQRDARLFDRAAGDYVSHSLSLLPVSTKGNGVMGWVGSAIPMSPGTNLHS